MSSTQSNKRVYALADANSFYVSCERIFRPDLLNVPLVVLSNNDGCAIAFGKEVKELGIPMATPWFKLEKLAKKHGIQALSSNYELYANASNRFMATLQTFSPNTEVYSIDECFLDFTGMQRDLVKYGHEIKSTVWQWCKLPICVGIGHSKTLAKLANHCAKKQPRFRGVCDFTSMHENDLDALFESLSVDKVWGIGSRLAPKLNAVGIENILRLKRADPKRIRDRFGVLMERTVKELNGEVWLELDEVREPSKQVMSSRSFGARITDLKDLSEAITYHATNAAQRLRKQGLYANAVYVFIQNSPFDEQEPYYGNSLSVALPSPTNSTLKFAKVANWLLEQIYKPGYRYQKAGVMLMELVPAAGQQTDLFGYSNSNPQTCNVMTALDRVNKKYGRGTLKLAGEGLNKAWVMRREMKSPNYLGDWDELPVAYSR